MIELKNIVKKYNNQLILNNINIKFREKELVCILGPSGSGKTTLLNLIGALDKADSGNIIVGGINLNIINKEYYHNKLVSFIFQNYNLISNLNIYNNLTLPLKLTNKKINILKINYYLKKFNLNKNPKASLKNLSGGEKQRIAIIRALLTNSKIILADEPSGALDSSNGEKVMQILKQISKDKLVIVVTHNEKLAHKYSDRIIKLKDGEITSDTNPFNKNLKIPISPVKTKLKIIDKIKLCIINLKSKKLRNILTIIAFSIGLFSLTLVLSISNGFTKELNDMKKNSLFNYPLIINKEAIKETNNILDNKKYQSDRININNNYKIIKNNLDEQFVSKINEIKNQNLAYSAIYHKVPIDFSIVSYINPTNNYFKIIKGRFSQTKNETMLLIDYNNSIDERVKDYLKIKDLSYDKVLNKKLIINKQEVTITGIVQSNNEFFSSLNGLLYNEDLFSGEIESVYLYSTSYENKEKIKNILKDYNITDDAKDVLSLTKSLIDSISIILIVFSAISLIVSSIMICVMCYISIIERKKEIGLLSSLGTNKKDLKSIFITENKIIGLLSSFIAIIITIIISKVLNNYIEKITNFNDLIKIDYKIIIIIVETSLLLIEFSSFFPLRIIKKNSIIDNMRDI